MPTSTLPDMGKSGKEIADRLKRLEQPTAEAASVAATAPASVVVAKQPNGTLKWTFSIPKGATGSQGPEGKPGPQGPAGTTTWAGITDKPAFFTSKGISMGRLP